MKLADRNRLAQNVTVPTDLSERHFLCVPKSKNKYTHQHDRDYFARPVAVVPIMSDARTGMLYDADTERQHVYPVCEHLKTWAQMDKHERGFADSRYNVLALHVANRA